MERTVAVKGERMKVKKLQIKRKIVIRPKNINMPDLYLCLVAIYLFLVDILFGTTFSGIGFAYTLLIRMYQVYRVLLATFILFKIAKEWEKDDVLLIILLALGTLSGVLGDGEWVMRAVWLICGCKNVNMRKLFGAVFVAHLLSTLLIMSLCISGQIENRYVLRQGINHYYAWGFFHPNALASRFFQLICLYVILIKDKLRYGYIVPIIVLALLMYQYTESETMTILLLVLGVFMGLLCFADTKKTKENQFGRELMRFALGRMKYFALLVPAVATFVMLNISQGSVFYVGTIASRIGQAKLYFDRYGLSLFGSELEINSGTVGWSEYSDFYTLDNSFLYLLVGYGVIFFVILIAGELVLFYRAAELKRHVELVVLSLYFVQGMFETGMIRIEYNFTLFYLALILFGTLGKVRGSGKRIKLRFRRN